MKTILKKMLNKFGREMRGIDVPMRSFSRGVAVLREQISPQTIIDIGVANGTPDLYQHFPTHPYLLIEANPNFRDDLQRLKTEMNAVVETVFCGAESGEISFNVYDDPRKGSVFNITRQMDLAEQLTVPVETLDGLIAKHRLQPPYLLKIDVEGAELDVLRGAKSTLELCEAVIAETAVLPKYTGGPELADLVHFMHDKGFSVFDIVAGVNHHPTQFLYQVDLIFVKTDASFRAAP
ncbi:MAG: FkbM family methyltransferase [Chloroflexi bacterium]|nr:FkbM family methyltransferase [Chloroflexota bacterium]